MTFRIPFAFSCKTYCSGQGYSYHGMTASHWCWCGNTAPTSDKLATGCSRKLQKALKMSFLANYVLLRFPKSLYITLPT